MIAPFLYYMVQTELYVNTTVAVLLGRELKWCKFMSMNPKKNGEKNEEKIKI